MAGGGGGASLREVAPAHALGKHVGGFAKIWRGSAFSRAVGRTLALNLRGNTHQKGRQDLHAKRGNVVGDCVESNVVARVGTAGAGRF